MNVADVADQAESYFGNGEERAHQSSDNEKFNVKLRLKQKKLKNEKVKKIRKF